jgi:CheY-like chemotaxis protein
MNLIVNGFEAIPGKGSLLINTGNRIIEQDEFRGDQVVKKGRYAVISVKDSGKGIANEHLEHIFEPFYSRKKLGCSGTGLGLTVVWNTVQEHGGKIKVNSSNSGTSFEILFPATGEISQENSQKASIENFYGNHEIIMVVDDEKSLLDLAETMLIRLNYHVVKMNSGENAKRYIRDHHIDLMVLDMIMAPGISGRQTYEDILSFRPDQRAIIASGFAENEDVERVLKLGASGFLRKPYTTNTLGKAVKEALEGEKEVTS